VRRSSPRSGWKGARGSIVSALSVHDDFFALGGHSLLARAGWMGAATPGLILSRTGPELAAVLEACTLRGGWPPRSARETSADEGYPALRPARSGGGRCPTREVARFLEGEPRGSPGSRRRLGAEPAAIQRPQSCSPGHVHKRCGPVGVSRIFSGHPGRRPRGSCRGTRGWPFGGTWAPLRGGAGGGRPPRLGAAG